MNILLTLTADGHVVLRESKDQLIEDMLTDENVWEIEGDTVILRIGGETYEAKLVDTCLNVANGGDVTMVYDPFIG